MVDKTVFIRATSGNTITIKIYDSTGTEIVDTNMTEGTSGVFYYSFSDDAGSYYAVFDDTTSGRQLGGYMFNLSSSGGATPAEIADAVWDEDISTHTTANTFGTLTKNIKSTLGAWWAWILKI